MTRRDRTSPTNDERTPKPAPSSSPPSQPMSCPLSRSRPWLSKALRELKGEEAVTPDELVDVVLEVRSLAARIEAQADRLESLAERMRAGD